MAVEKLAAGLSGATGYTLLTEAFFIDRQNLRLEALERARRVGTIDFETLLCEIQDHCYATEFCYTKNHQWRMRSWLNTALYF